MLIKTNALTYTCNLDPKIKGPLLIDIDYASCNALVTVSSYYLKNSVLGDWSLGPDPTVGTINGPSQNVATCEVKWYPSAIASNAYLVFSTGNYTDTLWPQLKCCNLPSGNIVKLQDVDDQDVLSAGISAAFQPYATLLSSNVVSVTGGTFFIEGQLNLQDTKIIFYDCILYMGSGAVIYTSDGYSSPGSLKATTTHFLGTDCGMWRGIYGPNDSRVILDNCTVEDAEFAIQTDDCGINLSCLHTTFNNNFVAIFFPHNLSGIDNQFIPHGLLPSEFSECTFGSNSLMILPPFNGQYGLPMDERPFAGMFLNDIEPSSSVNPSIPFATSSSTPCIFHNLNYGIYVRNGQADVYNCSFDEIYRSASYKPDFTSAIFLDNACSYCSTVRTLSVGNSNSNSGNTFDLCEVGVQSVGEVNADIFSNNFICSQSSYPHNKFYDIYLSKSAGARIININKNHFSNYNIGMMTYNIAAANLSILSNDFTASFVLPEYGSYSLTGILLLKKMGPTDIGFNTFNDSRISIYLNGVQGSSPKSRDCDIHDNIIYNNISYADLQAHPSNSIWCDYSLNAYIENNTFYRTPITPIPSDFDKWMRAINIKQSNDVKIFSNTITNFGTPMRFVSNCNSDKLQCNTMDQCYAGIYLDVASMTAQGAPGNPWDNSWTNYGGVDRVSGIPVGGPVFWYHRGSNMFICLYKRLQPWSICTWYGIPLSNETGEVCYGGGGGEGAMQKINEIVNNSIQYSDYADQSRYLDKQFAYEALKKDSTLFDSIPASSELLLILKGRAISGSLKKLRKMP